MTQPSFLIRMLPFVGAFGVAINLSDFISRGNLGDMGSMLVIIFGLIFSIGTGVWLSVIDASARMWKQLGIFALVFIGLGMALPSPFTRFFLAGLFAAFLLARFVRDTTVVR
ncbi:MAG: hypothetical protein Q3962_05365 [Corynebacterium sp.]|nr:hypothetical protein [Corynebacterium sp.]